MLNILKSFHEITVAKKKKRKLIPLSAIPTRRPTPHVNAAMETPPVIIVDVVRPVFVAFGYFNFFDNVSGTSISASKYVCTSVNFSKQYVCGLVGFR